MTRRFQQPVLFLGVLAVLTVVGCGTGAGAAPRHFADNFSPGLVLTALPSTAAWEYGRNDAPLNIEQPKISSAGVAVIITLDRRRTTNGRPREYSSTYIRTRTTRGGY